MKVERLTEKHYGNGNGYYVKCSETCHSICCDDCERDAEPVDRLGQIEDILGDTYDLDRLRELVEADKDGSCVVLPRDMKAYFIAEDIECNEKWIEYFPIKDVFLKCGFGIESLTYSLKDVGKKIWLSVEAAEAALTKEVDHDRT